MVGCVVGAAFWLLTAFGSGCFEAADETGAAVPGAKVERHAAVVAAMRVRFIGILPRMAVVSSGDHHIHAVRPL